MAKVFNNSHQACKFRVTFTFVSPDKQSGYQRDFVSNKDTKEEALTECLTDMLADPETTPLAGISIFECVYTA